MAELIGTWYILATRDDDGVAALPQVVNVEPDGTFCVATVNNTISSGYGIWFQTSERDFLTLSTYFRTLVDNSGNNIQYWAAGVSYLKISAEDETLLGGTFETRRYNLVETGSPPIEIRGTVAARLILPNPMKVPRDTDLEKFVEEWMNQTGPPISGVLPKF